MNSWGNRSNYHQFIAKAMIADGDGKPQPELTDDLVDWLAQLTLLYGVPVEYLVPDERFLPNESLRFFYIDRNWLDRLVDGAMSVGVLSSKEQVFNEAFFEDIYQQVDTMQQKLRPKLRKETLPDVNAVGGPMSGLVIRSQVVTDYPGVEVYGYAKANDKTNPLTILRMDRLSNSLLLCIFDGVPERVDFVQPGEGLHFGIFTEVNGQSTKIEGDDNAFKIYLRGLGFPTGKPQPNGYPAGKQIHKPGKPEQFIHTTGNLLTGKSEGVVDIAGAVKNIETALNGLTPIALDGGVLTSAGFAIQMVKTGQLQSYATETEDEATGAKSVPPPCSSE